MCSLFIAPVLLVIPLWLINCDFIAYGFVCVIASHFVLPKPIPLLLFTLNCFVLNMYHFHFLSLFVFLFFLILHTISCVCNLTHYFMVLVIMCNKHQQKATMLFRRWMWQYKVMQGIIFPFYRFVIVLSR